MIDSEIEREDNQTELIFMSDPLVREVLERRISAILADTSKESNWEDLFAEDAIS
jgi:hypothetical protein